jgi:hypothetical protein
VWRCHGFDFYLERVQNVNRFGKTNGVHGSPGVAAMMCDDLDDEASAKATARVSPPDRFHHLALR